MATSGVQKDRRPKKNEPEIVAHKENGITTVDVLQIFPGAKIVKRSAEQQFELIGKDKTKRR